MRTIDHGAGRRAGSGTRGAGVVAGALFAAVIAGPAAQAGEWHYLPDPDERQSAYRDSLRGAFGDGAAGAAPGAADRLVANAVGIAAAGCRSAGPAEEAWRLIDALAADLDQSGGALAVEARVAAATCALVAERSADVRAAFRAAADAARSIPDRAERDRLTAWVAEAAGATGSLPPQDIMEWATGIVGARARAVAVRGWALAGFIETSGNPLGLQPTLPFAPLDVDVEATLGQAREALDGGDVLAALRLAAATPTSAHEARRAVLKDVVAAAREQGDFALARMTVMAVAHPGDQDNWFAELAADAMDRDTPGAAAEIGHLMAPSRDAVNVWLALATRHRDDGYRQMVVAALDSAEAVATQLDAGERPALLARVAGRAAQVDDIDRAIALLSAVEQSDEWPKAVSDLAKRLAERDRLREAVEWAARIDGAEIDAEVRGRAFGSIAKAQAEAGDLDAAIETLERRPELAGRYVDRGLRAIVVGLARAGDAARAGRYLERIEDPEERSRAEAELGREAGERDAALDRFRRAIDQANAVSDPVARDRLLVWIARLSIGAGSDEMLELIAPQLSGRGARDRLRALHLVAGADPMADDGAIDSLVTELDLLTDEDAEAEGRAALAMRLMEAGALRRATAVARGIADPMVRVEAFRRLAETQAKRLDIFDAIGRAPDEPQPIRHDAGAEPVPDGGRLQFVNRGGLAAYSLEENDYGRWVDLVGLADRLGTLRLTPADMKARIPAPGGAARVHRMSALTLPYNEKFIEIEPIIEHSIAQGEPVPHVIYIEAGVVTLSTVREHLLRAGVDDYLDVDGGIYTLRRPLIVGPDATLVLSGAEARELRMSTGHRAYLVVVGRLFTADITITSWDEEAGAPSEIVPELNEHEFRPFVLGWSDSEIESTRTVYRALGYSNRKSFGFSLSAGPQQFIHYAVEIDSPRALLVQNAFDRLYYGFYSAEVFTTDLIGNEYRNNVVYGPDPHDYSEDILLAHNTAYGTEVKHGLIASREVDGIFVGNLAFDNYGAGIMLDRLSNHSIIYANTVFDNDKDGISVYETACVIVANNHAFDNELSGVRVRNSTDIAIFDNNLERNHDAGIVLYTDDLLAHTWRDLEMDPFWTVVTATIADNRIVGNGNAMRVEQTYAMTLADNAFIENGPRAFTGDFDPIMTSLMRHMDFAEGAMLLTEQCLGPLQRRSACGFRDLGVFAADGQQEWSFEGDPDVCSGNYRLSNEGLMRQASQ